MTDAPLIAAAAEGLVLPIGTRHLHVAPLHALPGDRLLLVPQGREETVDVAAALARVLTGLQPPDRGRLTLLGQTLADLPYLDVLKLRTHIGLVQGRGGLLANRTVRDNALLPLSVHGGLDHAQEQDRLTALLEDLELTAVQQLRPHVLDDAARFRACAARALVLRPRWLVVEGQGDFEATAHGSHTWQRLMHHMRENEGALVACLPRPIAIFERWWLAQGGHVLPCPFTDPVPDRSLAP